MAVLTLCGATVGGVMGVLLPKLSVALSLGLTVGLNILMVGVISVNILFGLIILADENIFIL